MFSILFISLMRLIAVLISALVLFLILSFILQFLFGVFGLKKASNLCIKVRKHIFKIITRNKK